MNCWVVLMQLFMPYYNLEYTKAVTYTVENVGVVLAKVLQLR